VHRIQASEQRFPPVPPSDKEAWKNDARCNGLDTEIFFPEPENQKKWQEIVYARKKCVSCMVKLACLGYAIRNNEPAGIWGGMTTKERTETAVKRISTNESLEDEINYRILNSKRQANGK